MKKILRNGGIIATYKCTAACRHCLYASSPDRSDQYITEKEAEKVSADLLKGGCRSVHIGGGEPFIDFDGLLQLIRVVTRAGILIEYVETNAFWVEDDSSALERLNQLSKAGADTLCISLDPFHMEYVPYGNALTLARLCERVGMNCFLWQQRFLSAISHTDPARPHSRADLENALSKRYILDTARAYGLRYGGRAVNIEMEYSTRKKADELIHHQPCQKLIATDHFHIDQRSHFIPSGCTGIFFPLEEVLDGLPDGKYPVFEALYEDGLMGLYAYAKDLGFVPDAKGYPSSCTLCFFIRAWLAENHPSPELDVEHYSASLSWY